MGPAALSTAELLSLLLGTSDGLDMATDLLIEFPTLRDLVRASEAQLRKVKGVGKKQAAQIRAMMELAQRISAEHPREKARITCPADAANLVMNAMRHLEREEFRIILVDTRNQVLGERVIYQGSTNTMVIRSAEVFRPAIEAGAMAIILVHNQPSVFTCSLIL